MNNFETGSPPKAYSKSVSTSRFNVAETPEPVQRIQQLVDNALKAKTNKPSFIRLAVVVGLATTILVVVYAAMLPFHRTFVGRLFWHQHFFGPLVTFLTAYSASTLFVRYLTIRRYAAAFDLDLLPHQIGNKIGFKNAGTFLEYLNRLKQNPNNPLISRLTSALAHFISKKNTRDVNAYVNAQADSDAHAANSAYSNVRFIVWLLPILGFIGTVYGIGSAVGGFSGAINGGSDIGLIKDSLTEVTTGLGTSFNTTLLALVMSVFVMYPKNFVQKYEESFLVQVDSYCHENFLRRLEDLVSSDGNSGDEFVRAFEQVLGVYQERWENQCTQLMSGLGEQLALRYEKITDVVESQHRKQNKRLQQLLTGTLQQSDRVADKINKIQVEQAGYVGQIADRLSTSAESIRQQFELIEPGTKSSSQDLRQLADLQKSFVAEFSSQMTKLSKAQRSIENAIANSSKSGVESEQMSMPPEMLMAFKAMIKELRKISTNLNEKPTPERPNESHPGLLGRLFGRKALNGSHYQEYSNA